MSALDELEIAAIRGGVDESVLNRARAELLALRSAASERDAEVERAVVAEREACVAIAKARADSRRNERDSYAECETDVADELSAAIRARG